ncbi:MAG: glutamate ligase domain-containing protein, partial [Mycobacteriales bacterium]
RGKRPLMGAAAARGAGLVIVTGDNPRTEDPATIRAEVLGGARSVTGSGGLREIGDRRAAIAAAVAAAGPEDVVVVAGTGHEPGQEAGGVVHPFDDRDVLRAEIEARISGCTSGSGGR